MRPPMGEEGAGIGLDLGEADGSKERTIPDSSISSFRYPPRLVLPPPIPSGVGHNGLEGEGEAPVSAEQVEEGVPRT